MSEQKIYTARANRFLITIAVMSATLIQVLDTTIVNVSLPHMQGGLSATPDQITWVLTSYLVGSAIFMPLTGFFTDRLGQKLFLQISIGGFVASSIFCGAANSLSQIVVFRLLQGIFGAGLVPLSQVIMANTYPVTERGKAMALWGIGVMIGPILGPTLGGYLTEVASWRWNFYINVPVGIASMLLISHVLPDTKRRNRQIDWIGLILLSSSIGSLQYFLDRGSRYDWFHSSEICIAAFMFSVCMIGFIWYSLGERVHRSLFDINIFKDRNFIICSCLISIFGLSLYGSMIMLPLMAENLLNYPVITTGLVMAPRGLSTMISMMITGHLVAHTDPRKLIFIGILLSGIGTWIGVWYSLSINQLWIMLPIIFQGFGLGLVMVPLSSIAFYTLPASMRSEASGLFSLVRTIGNSAGISIVSTLLFRKSQHFWNQLGGFINPYNPATHYFLQKTGYSKLSHEGVGILVRTLSHQSQMLAFINTYAFVTLSFLVMLPLVFFLKKPDRASVSNSKSVVN